MVVRVAGRVGCGCWEICLLLEVRDCGKIRDSEDEESGTTSGDT
jgi:hypothetical protein